MTTDWRASRFISGTGINEMLLNIPDIRQTEGHTCGDAAALCVLSFHNIAASFRLATKQQGADPVSIESKLRQLGMNVVAGELSIGDLSHYCKSGRPVICLVHWPDGDDSHYVTVKGVSKGYVYFQDPESGPSKCKISEFQSAWEAIGRIGTYRNWGIVPWVQ